MHRYVQLLSAAALGVCTLTATPVMAEVTEAHDDHFITRAEAVVDASRTEAWLALISPAKWWDGSHTWSADAANLRLRPQAGGCFCETIPEREAPDGAFTLEGSVEHMRVIQAYPEVALRMSGALGPLQSEPVIGILTIAMSDVEPNEEGGARTRIVWEYNVGGKMRYPVPVISNAVDGVMTLQLTKLAELLGPVELPGSEDEVEATPADEGEALDGAEDVVSDSVPQESGTVEEPGTPSVEDAFEDLNTDEVPIETSLEPAPDASPDSGV